MIKLNTGKGFSKIINPFAVMKRQISCLFRHENHNYICNRKNENLEKLQSF